MLLCATGRRPIFNTAKNRATAGYGVRAQSAERRSARYSLQTSGEARLRVYEGTGKTLVCWTPYWDLYVMQMMGR